jgi:group I intron endonuclease
MKLPIAIEFKDLHLTETLNRAKGALRGLSGIYCIKNLVTGAMYIGSAVDLSSRIMEHLVYGKSSGKSNEHLQRAISYYGLDNFVFNIIEFVTDKGMLLVREQHYLDILFTLPATMIYNYAKDAVAPMTGRNHTSETKAKLSEAIREEKNPIYGRVPSHAFGSGEKNPMYGRTGRLNPMYGKVPQNAVAVNLYNANNEFVTSFTTQKAAAKWLGVSQSTVSRAIRSGNIIQEQYIISSSSSLDE